MSLKYQLSALANDCKGGQQFVALKLLLTKLPRHIAPIVNPSSLLQINASLAVVQNDLILPGDLRFHNSAKKELHIPSPGNI